MSAAGKAGFVARHGLWSQQMRECAQECTDRIAKGEFDTVRFSFVDQHGVLRGKTAIAAAAQEFFDNGCGIASSLLLKDTAHRTVFPVWSAGEKLHAAFRGAGDMVIVPDPTTFKALPWTPRTAWVLCDPYFQNGDPIPFSTRRIAQESLSRLAGAGYDFRAGLEIEFHIFRLIEPKLGPNESGQPGAPPEVALTTQGYQYLTEARADQLEPAFEAVRDVCERLQLPLRTLEVEFGPSQAELTLAPMTGLAFADAAVLLRAAVKQACRRLGYHATFMCRPRLPNMMSSGWHLHQSLVSRESGKNAFAPARDDEALSPVGGAYAAGLLKHAAASCLLTTPTLNGYKRYRPYSLAPDRILCGRDNRAAMLRVISAAGSAASRIENRIGEPAANPYLYMASQILTGLEGVEQGHPAPHISDAPYETEGPRLPRHLLAAVDAFEASDFYRGALGAEVVDYLCTIKHAELDRFFQHVTDWEHSEYFDLF